MRTDPTEDDDPLGLDADLILEWLPLPFRLVGRFIKNRFEDVGNLFDYFDSTKTRTGSVAVIIYTYCGIAFFVSMFVAAISLFVDGYVIEPARQLVSVGTPLGIIPFAHAWIFVRRRHRRRLKFL